MLSPEKFVIVLNFCIYKHFIMLGNKHKSRSNATGIAKKHPKGRLFENRADCNQTHNMEIQTNKLANRLLERNLLTSWKL